MHRKDAHSGIGIPLASPKRQPLEVCMFDKAMKKSIEPYMDSGESFSTS